MKPAAVFLLVLAQALQIHAFQASSKIHAVPQTRKNNALGIHSNFPHPTQLQSTSSESAGDSTTSALSKSQEILTEFHQSNLPFRIVVIGNGAILETTSKLGPKTSTTVSPKTGDKLMTFASEDASFEFHVKVDQVCKITFVASERPLPDGGTKVMRVSRFLSEKGVPICSLILADSGEDGVGWFEGMAEKYGDEVLM